MTPVSVALRRFIPAGAGNTLRSPERPSRLAVYPRWRGEHFLHPKNNDTAAGLSPLARGTPAPQERGAAGTRFIPAGAGNTFHMWARGPTISVYPRWRGEHSQANISQLKAYGLSPLARGTRPPEQRIAYWRRFIPAGAGNTYDAGR